MKILLTGSKGNLGQALQRQGKAFAWTGLGRGDWHELGGKLENQDVIIHAASDLVTPCWRNPSGVMDSNLMTTVRLLEALKQFSISKFIFVSSCAVYGRSSVTSENVAPTPLTINGTTKLLNEQIVREYCEAAKVDYTIVRVFNTFGGDDRFSILHHMRSALKNRKPFMLYNDGVSQRDFIHVDDVARLMLSLVDKTLDYRTFNLGSGQAVKIREIVDAFRSKYPDLAIVRSEREEAEYSRADISRLTSIIPNFEFQNVLEFIKRGA